MYTSQGKKDLENVLISDLFHLQVSMYESAFYKTDTLTPNLMHAHCTTLVILFQITFCSDMDL